MLFAYLLAVPAGLFISASGPAGGDGSPANPLSLLRAAARQTGSLLWTTNRDLQIVQLVCGIEWLDELTASFIGRTVYEIVAELGLDDRPIDAHRTALEDGEFTYEADLYGQWLELQVSALVDAAGDVIGTAGVVQDTTRRRRAEEGLKQSRLELEDRVETRTAELAEANERLTRSEQLYRGLIESQEAMIVRVDTEGHFTFVNEAYCRKFGQSQEELIDKKFQPLVHEDDLPGTLHAMEKLYEPPYRVSLEQRAWTVDGLRWLQWEDIAIRNKKGDVIEIQAIGRDITAHKAARDAEREQRVLSEALADSAAALTSTLNLDEVLDRILDNIRRVVNHDTANIMLIEEGGQVRIVRASGYEQHTSLENVMSLTFNLHDTLVYQQVMDTGKPLVLTDVGVYPGWRLLWKGLAWIRSFVCAPIGVEGEVIGFLNLDSAETEAFSERHARRLAAFADQAGIAIRNARLYQRAQELAVMQERNAIAQDLHDSVNQTLFSANVIAQSLSRLMDEDTELVRENLAELGLLTSGALAEMRTLLMELRPKELQRAGLVDLLRQLVKAFVGRTPASISLEIDGRCSLPVETRIMLYRIAQEGLNNIARHARPENVEVGLRCRDDSVELHIQDDGRGFDPAKIEFGSLGLQIMRERAESIGAELTIDSTLGEGTTVTVRWEPDTKHDNKI